MYLCHMIKLKYIQILIKKLTKFYDDVKIMLKMLKYF